MSAMALGQRNDFLNLSIGVGIQSYPYAIDPFELTNHYPVLYPALQLSTEIIDRISMVGSLSRIACYGSLYGPLLCIQDYELVALGLGFDYNIGKQKRGFKTGVQLIVAFSQYGMDFYDKYSNVGFGVKLYAFAAQPLTDFFSFGVRTAIERLHIQPYVRHDPININSFSVELLSYISL